MDDERIGAVSLRVKGDDVVAAFQGRDRMLGIEFLEPDFEFPRADVDAADIAHRLALIARLAFDALHVGVKVGQAGEEVGPVCDLLQRCGDQALDGEGGGAGDVETGDAGEDDEFACYVDAVEIVARVWFGVAFLLGVLHLLAPGAAFAVERRERVEEKTHGAGEDAFDLHNFIARIDEIFERGDNGQAGPDGRFVIDESPIRVLGRVGGGAYVAPQTERVAESFLVGCHDADAFSQEQWIRLCHVLAAGVVHEHAFPRRVG